MKFGVYLALIGMASCHQLVPETGEEPQEMDEDWEDVEEEEDLEEMLKITFNERNRRLERLGEAQYKAWRNIREHMQESFGKKFEMMGRRYGPVGQELSRSKAVHYKEQWKRSLRDKNLNVRKMDDDIRNMVQDFAGGREWYQRPLYTDRSGTFSYERLENKGGDPNDRRRMVRVGINNSDLKDIIEDGVDILKDFDNVMRDIPLMKESHKFDMAIMNEDSFKKMLKMAMDDFKIHSMRDFGRKAGEFGKKMEYMKKMCPMLVRMRKINERLFRELVKTFKVTDIPAGRRMSWVNWMTNFMVQNLQTKPFHDPVEVWKRMVERSIRDFARDSQRWGRSLGYDRVKWD